MLVTLRVVHGFVFAVILIHFLTKITEERLENDPIYIQRIFLDKRGKEPLIRVLALNECHRKSILNVAIRNTWIPLQPIPIYETCPEKWSPGCKLVAYFHEVKVKEDFDQNQVVIRKRFGESKVVPLEIAAPANQIGMTICVAPMYWYSDWAKLILFIEFWKMQEVDDMMIYVQSTTKDVDSVLKFYEEKGWITVVHWPELPKTETYDPNADVFQVGQVLAYNECTLRSTRKFTIYPDLDELMVSIGDDPLYEYVHNRFRDSSVGYLGFPHYAAYFDPPLIPKPFSIEKVDFAGVRNMQCKRDPSRIQKVIVRTDVVKRMAIHQIAETRNGEKEAQAEGILFHIRYNFVLGDEGIMRRDFGYYLQTYMQDVAKAVFNNGTLFNSETETRLGKCIAKWRTTPTECLAPCYCREIMKNMETWVEATNSEVIII